jgi:hypothetical protein
MIRMRFSNANAMVMSIMNMPLVDMVDAVDPQNELAVASDAVGKMQTVESNIAVNGYHIDRIEDGFVLYAPTMPTAYMHLGEILCENCCNSG